MKKIIIILILVLTITGCIQSNQTTPTIETNVYKGSEGLEIEFLKDSPPKEVYVNETFQVVTLLKNKGAYDLTHGNLVLTYEEDYINTGESRKYFELDGKNIYNPSDDEILHTFSLKADNIPKMSETLESLILVTACYGYKNKLSTDVCIDTDPHNTKEIEKACQIKTQSFSGQGSPVIIEKIEQKNIINTDGVRPQFKIHISNRGKGEVISKDEISSLCSSTKIEKNDINGVILNDIRFSSYSMSEGEINCLPETLKLVQDKDYFICTINEGYEISSQQASYLSSLYIEFEYGYTITESKTINIKKITT